MTDHNGVLMMQRALLAGTLGLAMARKAAAILEGDPRGGPEDRRSPDDRNRDGAVLRAILDAANECLGHFDDRPAAERWWWSGRTLRPFDCSPDPRVARVRLVPGTALA